MDYNDKTMKHLIESVGLSNNILTGRYRRLTSSKNFPTMHGRLSNPIEYFRRCMTIEMEHGAINPNTDVTHDNPTKIAKIVAAHILGVEYGKTSDKWKLFPSYYDWLIHMEHHGNKKQRST